MRHAQRGVTNLTCFFTEDGTQKSFFGGKLGLAFRGNLTDQNITGVDFSADADDTVFVEVCKCIFTDVRNVAGDFFRPELGVAGLEFVFFNMDRSIGVVADQFFVNQNRVFVVVTFPGHKADEGVFTEGDFTVGGCGTVGDNFVRFHGLAFVHDRALVDACTLVGTHKLNQFIAVHGAVFGGDFHEIGADLGDLTGALSKHDRAGVNRGLIFHTGTDNRGFGF